MKITDIKQQQKDPSRLSIYVDKRYSFSLTKEQCRDKQLKVGQEVSAEQIESFRQLSDYGKLFNRALALLARRPRSEWEIRSYLQRKDVDANTIEKITSQLKEYNYLNDREFAASWVRSRRALKSVSRRRLEQELRKKRVSNEVIAEVLEEDEAHEPDVLRELIQKKSHQKRYQEDPQKLMAYCARQGFRYGDIRQVMEELELL